MGMCGDERAPVALGRLDNGSARAPCRQFSTLGTDKGSEQFRDFIRGCVQCKMTCIKNVNLCLGYIFPITLRFPRIEREVIFAPDDQQAWLFFTHPCLPFWIRVYIGSIVVEQVALNLSLAKLVEKIEFVGPEIRVITLNVGIISDMPRARGCQRQ